MSHNKVLSKISLQSAKMFPEDFFVNAKAGQACDSARNCPSRLKEKALIIKRSKSKGSRNNSFKPAKNDQVALNSEALQNVETFDTMGDNESKTADSPLPSYIDNKTGITQHPVNLQYQVHPSRHASKFYLYVTSFGCTFIINFRLCRQIVLAIYLYSSIIGDKTFYKQGHANTCRKIGREIQNVHNKSDTEKSFSRDGSRKSSRALRDGAKLALLNTKKFKVPQTEVKQCAKPICLINNVVNRESNMKISECESNNIAKDLFGATPSSKTFDSKVMLSKTKQSMKRQGSAANIARGVSGIYVNDRRNLLILDPRKSKKRSNSENRKRIYDPNVGQHEAAYFANKLKSTFSN